MVKGKRNSKPVYDRPASVTVPIEALPLLVKISRYLRRDPGEIIFSALQVYATWALRPKEGKEHGNR
jgi:hypothetical protein